MVNPAEFGFRRTLACTLDVNGNPVYPVVMVSGTRRLIILDPDDADAADAVTERYDSATGCLAFRIIPLPDSIAAVKALIFGWSNTASDLAAVNAAMAEVDTEVTTPAGTPVLTNNVGLLVPTIIGATNPGWVGDTDWVLWDGTNTIKTIAVRASGADYTVGVALEVIE